ncbi:hypothetical protein ACJJJB_00100 (plasmid) [Microbulbifer sp. ANSA001]|uniref:hypothetical protein n=1 Tax=Microbulbifer sp. ANSA001 TaxID=3243358 RepID=UPI0040435760
MATQAEVAAHLFLTDRTVRDLQKKPGAPVSRGRGGYDLNEWRLYYINYLRGMKGLSGDGSEPETDEELEREDKALKRREARLKVEERAERIAGQKAKRFLFERTYGPLTLITHTVEQVASAVNSRLEALPLKVRKACPDLPPEAFERLDLEIIAASNELAEIEPDLSGYAERSEDSGDPWAVDFEEDAPG